MKMMNKLFAIYMCVLLIIISILLMLVFPASLLLIYMDQGFSGVFIVILVITILIEPLAIGAAYELLTSIKEIYNYLSM